MRTYEAMFMVDPAHAARDWNVTEKHVLDILKRHKAEIMTNEKYFSDSAVASSDNARCLYHCFIMCIFNA